MFVNIYRNPLYVSQLLSDLLKDSSQNCGSDLTSCRMYEEKDHDYYLMSVPGYKKENIEIFVENHFLKVKGQLPSSSKERKSPFLEEEMTGSFEKTFSLPHFLDEDNIKASCEAGVLKIQIPRLKDLKAKKIEIS